MELESTLANSTGVDEREYLEGLAGRKQFDGLVAREEDVEPLRLVFLEGLLTQPSSIRSLSNFLNERLNEDSSGIDCKPSRRRDFCRR